MGGGEFKGKWKGNGTQEVSAAVSSCGHHLTDLSMPSELPQQYAELTGDPDPAAECHFP